MTARISLNLGRTGGHRPPLQSEHFLPLGKALLGKGGVAAPSSKWSRSFGARTGMSGANVSPRGRNKEEWFVQSPIIGGLNQPPRLRPLRMLRGIFLMGAATPPCPRRGVGLSLAIRSLRESEAALEDVYAARMQQPLKHVIARYTEFAMKYFALFYDVVEDFVERRMPYRERHLKMVREAHDRGHIALAGALGDPPDGALIVFHVDDIAVVENFAHADPYVTQGLVTQWEVKPWNVVVGGPQ